MSLLFLHQVWLSSTIWTWTHNTSEVKKHIILVANEDRNRMWKMRRIRTKWLKRTWDWHLLNYFLSNTEFLSISIPFSSSKETLIRAINPLFSVNLLPLTCSQFQQQGTAMAINRGFLLVQYLEMCVTWHKSIFIAIFFSKMSWKKYAFVLTTVVLLSAVLYFTLSTFQLLVIHKDITYINSGSYNPETLKARPYENCLPLHRCFHNTDCIRF